MNIRYATLSRTGKRSNNEDAFCVIQTTDNSRWLGIVCDGLGGHAFGEVASETVIKAIADYWKGHDKEKDTEEKVNDACLFAYNEALISDSRPCESDSRLGNSFHMFFLLQFRETCSRYNTASYRSRRPHITLF